MFHPFIRHDPAAMASAQEAGRVARNSETRSTLVENDVERLYMIVEALWTMLKEQHGYTEEQLRDRITEIDLRDGKLDGRTTSPPNQCPQCHRTLAKKRPQCLYCGHASQQTPFMR